MSDGEVFPVREEWAAPGLPFAWTIKGKKRETPDGEKKPDKPRRPKSGPPRRPRAPRAGGRARPKA